MDRRIAPRFDFDGKCWFDTGAVLRFVSLKNISESGAQLHTLSEVIAGESARLRWREPGEPEISVDAKVVWTKTAAEGSSVVGVVFERVHTPEPLTSFLRKREIDAECALESSPTSTPTSKP